ncbi:MAG: DUF4384 domain-containing protein, partial [Gemmatimonadales bacterium]|nr:DUF4384 domain-containing protein [Gemmatimonadales bacterium]
MHELRRALLLVTLLAPSALRAQDATPPPRLVLELNQDRTFRPGDRAELRVRARDDGYLLVLHLDPDRKLRVLYPLDPEDDTFLRGEGWVRLAGRGGRAAFDVTSRPGRGLILGLLTDRPASFAPYATNGHWDYRALVLDETQGADDEERLLLLADAMVKRRFVYDVVGYDVYPRQVEYAWNDPTPDAGGAPGPMTTMRAGGGWCDPVYYGSAVCGGVTYGPPFGWGWGGGWGIGAGWAWGSGGWGGGAPGWISGWGGLPTPGGAAVLVGRGGALYHTDWPDVPAFGSDVPRASLWYNPWVIAVRPRLTGPQPTYIARDPATVESRAGSDEGATVAAPASTMTVTAPTTPPRVIERAPPVPAGPRQPLPVGGGMRGISRSAVPTGDIILGGGAEHLGSSEGVIAALGPWHEGPPAAAPVGGMGGGMAGGGWVAPGGRGAGAAGGAAEGAPSARAWNGGQPFGAGARRAVPEVGVPPRAPAEPRGGAVAPSGGAGGR